MSLDLTDIRERFDYYKSAWKEVRDEAGTDMRYVGGNPWDDADRQERANRPLIAPEEMGQYFNQVINAFRANPRGVKFSPVGNGADERTAQFYQNKAREIEYRSHAQIAYMQAAENAIQRSYGYVRVSTKYESPRSANQEIVIEGFPDPDMVLLDPDAIRPDGSDMQGAFIFRWRQQKEFRKQRNPKIQDFASFAINAPSWIQGDQVLEAECWDISTRKRTLALVQHGGRPRQMFVDELDKIDGATREAQGIVFQRELRAVDYPTVTMVLTDGIEILHKTDWPGKYIPIVSCYGKILYVPEGGQTKRKILSMTRFGRDPWKAFCYCACKELEILGMTPLAPLKIYEGQMDANQLALVKKSMHQPVAAITFKAKTPATGDQILPLGERLDYTQAEHLQAIEVVKEGFRRSIQSAMGSNFLPTQAQKSNEKSGKALNAMEQAATQGTYHFVNSFEDMLRQVGVIEEDLIPYIYSQQGETGVMEADGTSSTVRINTPNDPEAFSTTGDHVVTVSTAPSSDSEREAVSDFLSSIVGQMGEIAQIAGPQRALTLFAMAIRMRNMGPLGDQIADVLDPPQLGADGKPIPPQVQQLMQQNKQLTQLLQKAEQEKQAKVVEQQGDFAIAKMKADSTSADKAADRAVKLDVAAIQAKIETMAMVLEELHRIGGLKTDLAQRLHDAAQQATQRFHDSTEAAKDRIHEHVIAGVTHQHAKDLAAAGVAGQMATQAQAAELAPAPDATA
jgi:hypothetical protein